MMHKSIITICCLALFSPSIFAQNKPKPIKNDSMYPSATVAKPYIDYDGKGFIINQHRTFLASGSIHYPRVPADLWEDRLLRMKQANFNCVESYLFWNFHEQKENVFDFTGDHDVEAFLNKAQKLGMYAILRVGPYVCAEWDLGGFPIWLKFKPPFNIRTNDTAYLRFSDHWYHKVLPIVEKHQINNGGNVLLVQLENEHPMGWGVVEGNDYFAHLKQQALNHHIEVPYFFSGLHHGGPPAIGINNTTTRTNPWFCTEFWSGWYDAYRNLQEKKLRKIDAANWAILAHAGGGYNYYMIHGGSNFETWNDNTMAASYDYGTAIGQAGDLRPMYYKMKRANQLAQSFQNIFGNGQDVTAEYKNFAQGEGVELFGATKSDDGTIVFLRNKTTNNTKAIFEKGGSLEMTSFGIYPIPVHTTVDKGLTIELSTLPILAVAKNEGITTLVFYGNPHEKGKVELTTNGGNKLIKKSSGIVGELEKSKAMLSITIPETGVEELLMEQKGVEVRVLAINKDLSLYAWLLGDERKQDLVFGPSFVRSLKHNGEKVSLIYERPYGKPAPGHIAVYGANSKSWHLAAKGNMMLDAMPAPALGKWQCALSPEIEKGFDDSKWLISQGPAQMGADGNISAFAWYRTSIKTNKAALATIHLKYSNNIEVFLNGMHVPEKGGLVKAECAVGENALAIFASHIGRNKAFGYAGTLDNFDRKGIFDEATIEINGEKSTLTGWKMRGGASTNVNDINGWSGIVDTKGRPAFYKTSFVAAPPSTLGANPILRVNYVGLTRGTIWVNGHNLGRYPEKINIKSLYIPECWLKQGNNTLMVFDETGASPSQVSLVVEKESSREVILANETITENAPIIVPAENPVRNFDEQNMGNLAFRKKVVGKETGSGSEPEYITDGDFDTEWSAKDNFPGSSFTIDLEKPQLVKTVEVYWEKESKNYKYTLEGSLDNTTWEKLGDNTTAVPTSPDSPSELSRLNLSGGSYRYLKITITEAKTIKVAECRVFGK